MERGAITYYTRYIDDILLTQNTTKITPGIIANIVYHQHNALPFTFTEENNNQ
jgi:hypothetical protein